MSYRWLLDAEVYAFLKRVPRARRSGLERALDRLAEHPFTEPSFIAFDAEGGSVFHVFVSDYVIAYHVDHAVRKILIFEIYRVDS